jgi:hypothetical protein
LAAHWVHVVLYMATPVAVRQHPALQTCYGCLFTAGEAKKLAFTAAMRKVLVILNTMLWDRQPLQRTTMSLTFQGSRRHLQDGASYRQGEPESLILQEQS